LSGVPLGPTHPRWLEFIARLQAIVGPPDFTGRSACRGDYRSTEQLLLDMGLESDGLEFEADARNFRDGLGPYELLGSGRYESCDCGILDRHYRRLELEWFAREWPSLSAGWLPWIESQRDKHEPTAAWLRIASRNGQEALPEWVVDYLVRSALDVLGALSRDGRSRESGVCGALGLANPGKRGRKASSSTDEGLRAAAAQFASYRARGVGHRRALAAAARDLSVSTSTIDRAVRAFRGKTEASPHYSHVNRQGPAS